MTHLQSHVSRGLFPGQAVNVSRPGTVARHHRTRKAAEVHEMAGTGTPGHASRPAGIHYAPQMCFSIALALCVVARGLCANRFVPPVLCRGFGHVAGVSVCFRVPDLRAYEKALW